MLLDVAGRGRPSRFHTVSAWVALTAGAASATCVAVLIVVALRGYDDDTGAFLMWVIGVSAVVALMAAVPGLRDPRLRPIAMEGVELAFVGVCCLTAIALFVYVVFAGYGG